MPKETIQKNTIDIDGADTHIWPALSVHWGKDEGSSVQLSLDMDAAQLRETLKDESLIKHAAFTDGLGINEIDRLIKVLQRARKHELEKHAG